MYCMNGLLMSDCISALAERMSNPSPSQNEHEQKISP